MIDWYYLQVMVIALAWQWGVNYACKSDEVLGKPADWMRKNVTKWINTPLFDCPYCMSSVHGTAFYWVFLNLDYKWWIMWPIFVVCLTGLSALLKE